MPHLSPLRGPAKARQDAALSVLILDDERFDRHRMARLCSGMQVACKVTNAITLDQFSGQLDADAYDLILVDYFLPDGTGLQALEAVRCSARNFNSATIMITGQTDTSVSDAALRAGCADYLTKDELTAQTFQRAVTNALQRAALTLEVEAQSFARAEVEAVLEVFATRFAGNIKPMVSRSLRLVRDLRADPTTDRISAVEDACIELWETLVTLERHKGDEMMAQTMKSGMPPAQVQARKPPSPFSRMRQ